MNRGEWCEPRSHTTKTSVKAFMVHAKDQQAKALHQRYGMLECPANPFHLYFLMKHVERLLRPE